MPEVATIFIIHHSPDDAAGLAQQLATCTHMPVQVAGLQLAAADYADIAADADTGAVIIDQYLDPHTKLGYTGLDVAENLRWIRPGLPLYLLANREDDFTSREAVVEQVVPEAELLQRCPVYAERILRAMHRYLEAMSEREQHYHELVIGKLSGALNQAQEKELASLRAETELPFAGSTLEQAKTWESSLRQEQELLDKFSTELHELLGKLP